MVSVFRPREVVELGCMRGNNVGFVVFLVGGLHCTIHEVECAFQLQTVMQLDVKFSHLLVRQVDGTAARAFHDTMAIAEGGVGLSQFLRISSTLDSAADWNQQHVGISSTLESAARWISSTSKSAARWIQRHVEISGMLGSGAR